MNSFNLILKSNSDLKKRSFDFLNDIIKLVADFPNNRIYWVLQDQLLKSATSVGANTKEASASSSKREFMKFFQISLKSANETTYWIQLLLETPVKNKDKINMLLKEVDEISKIVAANLLTMKGKRIVKIY